MTTDADVKEAWSEYLDSCLTARQKEFRRGAPAYEDVEPWAWSRLQQRLREVKNREKRTAA